MRIYSLVLLVVWLLACGNGAALVVPPDFRTTPCATAPICSPDMGRDLAAVEDLRIFLDLAVDAGVP